MAYKVYAGTVKIARNTDSQISGSGADLIDPLTNNYALHRMEWADKQLVYGPGIQYISDMKLDETKNDIGLFEFTVPKLLIDATGKFVNGKNPIYDSVDLSATKVMIEEDGVIIWLGVVTSVALEFDLSKKVVCKDPLFWTKHTSGIYRPEKNRTMESILGIIVPSDAWSTGDNSVKGCHIPVALGLYTSLKNVTVDTSSNGVQNLTHWEALNKYILDAYDGYIRLRYIADASHTKIVVVMDYLDDITDQTSQTVSYGQNMTDLEISRELTTDIKNSTVAYGSNTTTSGWWIWASSTTSFISSYMYTDDASINKYDRMGACALKDGNATKDELNQLAQKELGTYDHDVTPTVTVKAFDLCDTGQATDHLGFLKKTRIVSEPHGIDEWMVCTKAVLPLDKPDQKEFTFGRTPEKLTSQQNRNTAASEQASLSLKGLISYTQSKQG
nr:MAG TPA: endopeptidase tail [Caudoviricetes sp.]